MVREIAPAKLNLVLHVGPPDGGMHPIASLFASLELADELEVEEAAPGAADTVVCPGVEGENLAAVALRTFRERGGGQLPPLEVRIHKRIPIAAGLGGGSADAAAALRAANRIAGAPFDADQLRALAAALGSDVPSQVEPRHAIVTGSGEVVEPIELPPVDVVLLPDPRGLSARDVYAELDRREGWRERLDPIPLRELAGADAHTLAGVLDNDLGPAAIGLLPEVQGALDALRGAGALGAGVSGSGPTCFGLFDSRAAAERAATAIRGAITTRLRPA
jgi:4-diphosphocytidyl-2-C-methyl-D-erythritol kinase